MIARWLEERQEPQARRHNQQCCRCPLMFAEPRRIEGHQDISWIRFSPVDVCNTGKFRDEYLGEIPFLEVEYRPIVKKEERPSFWRCQAD